MIREMKTEQLLAALNLLGWDSARDVGKDIWIVHYQRKLMCYSRRAGGIIPMFPLPVNPIDNQAIDPASLVGAEAERWALLAKYVLAWEGGRR